MATTTVFSIGPDGKMNKYTFLETTKITAPKLYMECHWMVPCKVGISLCGYEIQDVQQRRTYGRHNDLVNRYAIFVLQ